MKLKIWLAVVVVITIDVLALDPRKLYAKRVSPALLRWRQEQILKRQKLQKMKHLAPQTVILKLIPANSQINIQRNLAKHRNELRKKNLNKVGRTPKLLFVAPQTPVNKKVVAAHLNKPLLRFKARPIKAYKAIPVYRSSKTQLGRAQVRNQLGTPVAGKAKQHAPSIGKFTDNLYPADAYQQVEHYVDSVIRGPTIQPQKAYFNANKNQNGASMQADRNKAAVASSPAVAPAPPPAPIAEPAPPPAPVAPPAPAPVAAPAPAPLTAPAVTPAVAYQAPAPAIAPAPIAPAPVYVAPGPKEAKAVARAAAPAPSAPDSAEAEGQVVQMAGPDGKPMKYYVQSYTSEILPDGKGGYKQMPLAGERSTEHDPIGPVKAIPLGPAIPPKGSPVKHAAKSREHINDCTVSNVNHTDEERQSSKRVYSLSGHVFADLGCYSDCWRRAIPTLEGNHDLLMDDDYKTRQDALQKCAEAALDRGFKYFALQNGGQCFAGGNANRRFNIYGHSDRCRDNGLGGTYANEVYMFEETPTPKRLPSSYEAPTEIAKDESGKCRHGNCEESDKDSYDASLLKEEEALSEEEEDEIEASNDPKKHKNKLKAIGAAIQSLLKKQDDDKGGSSQKSEEGSSTHKITTDGDVAKAKDSPVDILANVLLKGSKGSKHKSLLNSTSDSKGITAKFAKNESSEIDNLSNQDGSNTSEKGKDAPKKKKGLPLGAAIARGDKPPCICPDKVCSSKLDLAFAIDASAGAEPGGKEKMGEIMEFGRRVASAFKVAPAESHLGLITFSTDAQVMLNFKRFSDPESFAEAKDAVRVKPHTGKFTGQALRLAKDGLFGAVHRPDALDVLVLVTDGPSTDNVMAPARSLRDMGVKIIGVGIGDHINKRQMANIASDPDDANMFLTEFDNLEPLIPKVQKAACIGGILKEPTTPCRCEEKSTEKDPESEAETAAFLSLMTPSVETAPLLKAERHTDIPTASPADLYKFSSYILKREGISPSVDDRGNPITSRALPFNNPHPLDFDATPKLRPNFEHDSQQSQDATGSSKYEHSYENGNHMNNNEERNSGGKGMNTASPNIASMQTDEPEYTASEDQGNHQETPYSHENQNKNPSNALYAENEHENTNIANSKENKEGQNQQYDRPTARVNSKGSDQRYEGNTENSNEGQAKENHAQQTSKLNNGNEENSNNEAGSTAAGAKNEKFDQKNKDESKDMKNEGANDKNSNESSQMQQQPQPSRLNNNVNMNTGSSDDNMKEGKQSADKNDFNSQTHKENSFKGENGNNEQLSGGDQQQQQPQGQSQYLEKDDNSNQGKTDRQERKPDLSKEDLNTQGSQGNSFNTDKEQSQNENSHTSDFEVSGTESPSKFGADKDQNQKENQNSKADTDSAKQGKEASGLTSSSAEKGLPFKNDFSDTKSPKVTAEEVPSKGLEQENSEHSSDNKEKSPSTYTADEKIKDPKAKAEMYNQYVYKHETNPPMQGTHHNRDSTVKLKQGDSDIKLNNDASKSQSFEGTLYKDKSVKTTDNKGNQVEKQKYKGTLFLSGTDSASTKQESQNEKMETQGDQPNNTPNKDEGKQVRETEEMKPQNKNSQKFGTESQNIDSQNEKQRFDDNSGKGISKMSPENESQNTKNINNQNNDDKDSSAASAQKNTNKFEQDDKGKLNANSGESKEKETKQGNQEGESQRFRDNNQNTATKPLKNQKADAQIAEDNAQSTYPQSQNANWKQEDNNKYQPSSNDESKQPTQNKNVPNANQQPDNAASPGDKENKMSNNEEKQYESNNKEPSGNGNAKEDSKANNQQQDKQMKENKNMNNNHQLEEGEKNLNQPQSSTETASQQPANDNSFHGHGHGPHGHEDHHEHEEGNEHGHEGEHGAKKPQFSKDSDSDQRIHPYKGDSEQTQGQDDKNNIHETSNDGQINSHDGNSQAGQQHQSGSNIKTGFHYDTSGMQAAQKFESKQESQESPREQRTDRDNKNNQKVKNENDAKDKYENKEQQNKQEWANNEGQPRPNEKEERQETKNNKSMSDNRQENNQFEDSKIYNDSKGGRFESSGSEKDKERLKSEDEQKEKFKSKEDGTTDLKKNEGNEQQRINKDNKSEEEKRPEQNNGKELEKNGQKEQFNGQAQKSPVREEDQKGGSNGGSSNENQERKEDRNQKEAQNMKGNQDKKEDQKNIKEIQASMEKVKTTFKNKPAGQASSLADVEDNNYETINDIVKYPRKSFRNSDSSNIADENHHMIEKGVQDFRKGFNHDEGDHSEHHTMDQDSIHDSRSKYNIEHDSDSSRRSSEQRGNHHTPDSYNEDTTRPISRFHDEISHSDHGMSEFSELRKQHGIDGSDSGSINARKLDSKGAYLSDNAKSHLSRIQSKSLRIGPKGPSVWHKPPQVQNNIHQEGVSRDEEYSNKNPQNKKPFVSNNNKKPPQAQPNRPSSSDGPQKRPGFQQVELLQAPNGNVNGKGQQQQQPMDPDSAMLMRESEKAGEEMENEMNSNNMDNDMPDMNSENGGMRHHISRKAEPPGQLVPTAPVRDYVNSKPQIESYREDRVVTRGKIQRQSKKRAPIQLDGVQKAKTAKENKGILLKDPFLESSHFWPMDQSKAILIVDIQTGHNGILMNGSRIEVDEETKLAHVTTEYPGSYIILGDFNGTCFSDPGKCILGGLTVSFWAKLDRNKVNDKQDAYIISGGGQSKESRGFGFLFFHGTYVFVLSTANKQWKMMIPEENVPTGSWANFAFIWNKNGNLTFYLDGEKQMTIKGNTASRPTDKYPLITVGKPNNADKREYMYPLKIHSVAMWDRPLKSEQVKGIHDGLKTMRQKGDIEKKFRIARPKSLRSLLGSLW